MLTAISTDISISFESGFKPSSILDVFVGQSKPKAVSKGQEQKDGAYPSTKHVSLADLRLLPLSLNVRQQCVSVRHW
jgi:hypothetical protein